MRASLSSTLVAAAARLSGLRADDRGNVLVYVSLTAAVLLGMVGLALDGSRAMITHSEVQAAADAAALAGASQLDARGGACARAKAEAQVVVNQQRFATTGLASVTVSSSNCLSTLPSTDITAIPTNTPDAADGDTAYIQVTTQQLTHQNTLLDALSSRHTATIQRTAVAGFRRSLCAGAPVMMMCNTLGWTPGVAFDAWDSNGASKGWLSDCGNSAPCVQNTLASTQPKFCVVDNSIQPVPGNKTEKAQDGINERFGQGSSATYPSDLDVVDFTSYSSDINGVTNSTWNCAQYWADTHGGLAPAGCGDATNTTMTRYAMYQLERAGTIPAANQPAGGTDTTPAERRLVYLAIFNCGNPTAPEAFIKAFIIGRSQGSSSKTAYVEPLGLATPKTDPTAVHEEIQLYR